MKNLYIKTILLFLAFMPHGTIYCQEATLNLNPITFRFIAMEFHADLSAIYEKIQIFDKECENQQINSSIDDPIHVILVGSSGPPRWQLAYPIKKCIPVNEPLTCLEITAPAISIDGIQEPEIETAINKLKLQMMELKVYGTSYTIIRRSVSFNPNNPVYQIIIPIQERNSIDSMIGRVSSYSIQIAVCLYVFCAIFLLLYKHKKSHVLFALFMIFIAMSKLYWLLSSFIYTLYQYFPHVFNLGVPFNFLIAPSLYLYVFSITRKNFKFKIEHVLHLIPFIISLIIWFIRFYQYPAAQKQELILSSIPFSPFEQILSTIVINMQMIGYVGAAIFLIYRYQKDIQQEQASIYSRQITWFYVVLSGFFIMQYSRIIKHVLYHYMGIFSELFYLVSDLSTLIFVLIILYHIVRHPELFSIVDMRLSQKIKKYSLSTKVIETYKSQLIKYINQYKPYLDNDLTLQKLSEMVSIPSHSLSEVINRGFNQNFFEFINDYRVNEAKQLLAEPSHKKNILEIVYEVGYNNKSVFNAVFKKYTGKTPTQYRSQVFE